MNIWMLPPKEFHPIVQLRCYPSPGLRPERPSCSAQWGENPTGCCIYIFKSSQYVVCEISKPVLKYSGHAMWFGPVSGQHYTVVDLSTRTAFLNIDQSLQLRNFWSQSRALFMIRCMLSARSGSKTFGALKVTICVNFFELSVHKMSTFLRISACQWTIPSGLFAKKNHTKIFCSC
jgi:hypothetical protein